MSFYYDIVLLILLTSCVAFYKSIYLKISLVAAIYPGFILCGYKYGLPMRGILSINLDYFSTTVQNFALYTTCLSYLVFALFLWPIRKINVELRRLPISYNIRLILPFLFFIFCILGYNRTFGIDIGIEGGTLALLMSVLILASKKQKFELPAILHIIFLCVIILSGERVDSILTLVAHLFIGGSESKKVKISLRTRIITGVALFIMATYIDAYRGKQDYNFNFILFSLINQQTAVDVSYVYLTGVDFYLTKGTNLQLIYNAVFGLIPGTPYSGVLSDYNYTIFLGKNVLDNPGGGLYYTEGLLLFGVSGIVLYSMYFASIFKYFYKRKSYVSTVGFLLLFVLQLRIQWYGLLYLYKPLIVLCLAGLWFEHLKKKQSTASVWQ